MVLFITICTEAQTVDTIITTPIYKSYFSYQTHTPLFVCYELYKGGGNCSRANMSFETGGVKNSATKRDYAGSGYDIGHMADAEDFSYDCDKERQTFFFYNALPQTPRLNRGCWKSIETQVRKLSQTDSLRIICGGVRFDTKMGSVMVPAYCYKIIENLNTKQTVCYLFKNDDSDAYTKVEIGVLCKNYIKCDIILKLLK